MKTAIIKPVHKGGSKNKVQNYRPISLTSHIIKIFERVIKNKIIDFLENGELLKDFQHGFRRKRSCLTELIDHYSTILQHLENNENVDVIYLDFAKAFDKVDHGILFHKLRDLGISSKVGKWLFSFLTNRLLQAVKVNGETSQTEAVISGVPQGTVLGPVLFVIMINDILPGNDFCSTLRSFADDTRILRPISNIHDNQLLQRDLESVYKWANKNNMEFNDDKFELIKYGQHEHLKNITYYTGPEKKEIKRVEHVKDLGVILSSDATFNDHIEKVVSTSKQLTGYILRTFKTRDETTMITLWKQLILPRIEYCSQLWSPRKKNNLQKIEGLQRTFTAYITNIRDLNYWARLKHLKLFSIERRFERYLILYTWKILEGIVISPSTVPINKTFSVRTGRKCVIPKTNTKCPGKIQTLKQNQITFLGPSLFNCLPRYLRDTTSSTIDTMKRKLDLFLATIADEPGVPGYRSHRAANSNSIKDQIQQIKNF